MQGREKLGDVISVCSMETKEFLALTQEQLLKEYENE